MEIIAGVCFSGVKKFDKKFALPINTSEADKGNRSFIVTFRLLIKNSIQINAPKNVAIFCPHNVMAFMKGNHMMVTQSHFP